MICDDSFDEIKTILSKYTKRAYLVGGCVRDIFLGLNSKDFDIEIYDIKCELFDKIMQDINAIGVGKSFFVYKYKNYDLSLPRTENKLFDKHNGFEVAYCNDEKIAAKRRDFTINSMMINIFDGTMLDFYGGRADLEKKLLRCVNESSFIEDSLRVYRGVGFSSRFGFLIEKNTQNLMQKMQTKELSKTRIFWELQKIFSSDYPHFGLMYLHKFGLLKEVLNKDYDKNKIPFIANEVYKSSLIANEYIREYYFLYILVNELNLDMKSVLEHLDAPKVYFKMLLVPYFDIDDFTLISLSLQIPLKLSVVTARKSIKERALKLRVYEQKFKSNISSKSVIDDGFSQKEIGEEIRKRQKIEIEKYLKDYNE